MKTKFFLTAMALMSCTLVFAQWTQDGANIYYNKTSGFSIDAPKGKVGIGTTTPNQLLEIFDRRDVYMRIHGRAATSGAGFGAAAGLELMSSNSRSSTTWRMSVLGNSLRFNNPDTKFSFQFANDYANFGLSSTPLTMRLFGKESDGEAGTLELNSTDQKMILDGNEIDGVTHGVYINNNTDKHVYLSTGGGNVGIGTARPGNKLDVNGGIDINDYIRHNGDSNTYLGFPANDQFVLSTADQDRFIVKQGRVGIGMSNLLTPAVRLHVAGSSDVSVDNLDGGLFLLGSTTSRNLVMDDNEIMARDWANPSNTGPLYLQADGGGLYVHGALSTDKEFVVNAEGQVGIGDNTFADDDKLNVNGKVKCREVHVTNSGWADFVFANDYDLMPLEQVENFIGDNKHLPDVPSEEEVLANGTNLGDIDAILLRKIEELTLHVIEMNKRVKTLETENQALKAKQ